MINLLYLDNNDKVIEEIEEIDVEKDYDLNKLYFVVDNFKDKIGYLKEKLQIISMDISDIYREYNLNHLEHSANTIYTISKSKFLLMQSGLVEHINLKCKNKIESSITFSETDVLTKATNLAISELLGDADLINQEIEKYAQVTREGIREQANLILDENNCSTLYYLKKK